MFKINILQLFLALQFPLLNDEPLEDQTHTVNQDQINDFLAIHYFCRERLNVRRFNLNRLDDCSTNQHDVAYNKPRVDLFIRAKATIVLAYQFSLSYTKTTEIFVNNTKTNH